jgi:broad specificity phosphatase PhoE
MNPPRRAVLELPVVDRPPAVPTGRAFVIRHGLVHNPHGMMYGWLPRWRLADEGRRQAEATASWLAANDGKQIALILTSPLLRARQTARIVDTRLHGVRVRRSRLLIEGGLARHWQGNYWATLPERFPEEHRVWQEAAGSLEVGESMAAQARRMQAALALALRLSGSMPAVCVSHRDPIISLRLAMEGRSFDELHSTDCAPASVTVFDSDGAVLRFVEYVEPYSLPPARSPD